MPAKTAPTLVCLLILTHKLAPVPPGAGGKSTSSPSQTVLPEEPMSLHRSPPAVPSTHHTSVVPVWSQPSNHTQASGPAGGSPRCVHERAGTSGRHELCWFPRKSVRASSAVLPVCWDVQEWGCTCLSCGVGVDFIPSCP